MRHRQPEWHRRDAIDTELIHTHQKETIVPQKPQNPPEEHDTLSDLGLTPGPIQMFEPKRMDQLMRALSAAFDALAVMVVIWIVHNLLGMFPMLTLGFVFGFVFLVSWTERR